MACRQDTQFKLAMLNLPKDVILSHIHFVENYTFQIDNDIHSMHWHSFQVTILVHITYRLKPIYNETNSQPRVTKKSHFYVSNDKEHDMFFIQHCLLLHWEWLVGQGVKPWEHWVLFNSCACQFKGAKCMFFVVRYFSLMGGCKMRWGFFGTCHEKGKWSLDNCSKFCVFLFELNFCILIIFYSPFPTTNSIMEILQESGMGQEMS